MPEVICLISSSPPRNCRRSKSPLPAKKSQNRVAKLAAASATFDSRGKTSTSAPRTKEKYVDNGFSAHPSDSASSSMKTSPKAQKSITTIPTTDPQLNDKDYVFVHDDVYSSEIDLSKEYSLHLRQMGESAMERARAKVAAAQAERNGPALSPLATEKSSSDKPTQSPRSSRATATMKPNFEGIPRQSRYRAPVTAAAPKTAVGKPSEAANKVYIFLDDDFSSSIDLDKEYDLGLPTQKRRKVTPEPEAYEMSERKEEKHGVPGLFSSPVSTRSAIHEKAKEIKKCGLSDPLSPSSKAGKPKPAAIALEKHGLPDLFSSPGNIQSAVTGDGSAEGERYILPDSFSTSSKQAKPKQAQVDDVMGKAFVGKSTSPKATTNEASLPKLLKRAQDIVLDSDPITFTSSPDPGQMDQARRKRREQALTKAKQLSNIGEPAKLLRGATALEVLDSDSDDLPELPSISVVSRTLSRTTSDTSHLKATGVAPHRSKPLARSKSMADASVKSKKVAKTDDEKAAEKAEKEAAKEVEAERKRKVKEEKLRDKALAQELAKVNTLKTDKKKSTPEMIVLFPQEMDKRLRETAEGFLAKLSVEYRNWAGAGATPGEVAGSGLVKNVVRWKRKVDAVHNEREDIWEPVPRRIENEKHVLVYLLGKDFVELATADEDENLNQHAAKLTSHFYDHKIIYLIEGLTSWQKKNTNLRNRQFAAAVRAQADSVEASTASQPTTSSRGRKKRPLPEYISDDLIEDALLSLQIKHRVLIHHTASLVESAEWISIFTQHISTIPYRLQKMNLDTSFCMESGQVRGGEDARDTFVKMLCEMRGVTAPVGWGVEAEIGGGVKQLVEKFRREGKEALSTAKKGANRDGAITHRHVGKAISKRLHNVFMGRDPWSTDV